MSNHITFDKALIQKYNLTGPRYTSYPTAVVFDDSHTPESHVTNLKSQAENTEPLSLYFHIPFCDTLCFFCACNKIATKRREKADLYLDYLEKEMQMQSQWLHPDRPVEQLHLGGGTPTFLTEKQMRRMMAMIAKYFTLIDTDERDYSIEIDPREAPPETIKLLAELGFNRFSMGVQDVQEKVQKAVNRIQPIEMTLAAIEACRQADAKSINVDLIYGLPFQTLESFKDTLKQVIALSPDRLSVFNYAHLPHLFKPQKRILFEDLPSADEKLAILDMTIKTLNQAGYVYIGMDHFAKPTDELALAQESKKLHRNFQGYTTHADCDMLALGVSAISYYNNTFSQNNKSLEAYYHQIDLGHIPIIKGYTLSQDDLVRRQVIQELSCHFELNIRDLSEQFDLDFDAYFDYELPSLKQLAEDGLISWTDQNIKVTSQGRLLIRNICMVFDIYLRKQTEQQFSKVI
ncbi:oxygen-independent coproporphyrinogen III oxidase [Marinicella rhabdoformis]|uniref:oxygen-independent coproporphyrinogen III oxidase n=1 Tax=Marinicella rhabdoformis TaxID=2580566 RepID=UPI0012AED6DF|nr:oxygen-independent coproporphyrinogen III oxidase [Marinicella rhabdoformis]